jgi:hypothetical protein
MKQAVLTLLDHVKTTQAFALTMTRCEKLVVVLVASLTVVVLVVGMVSYIWKKKLTRWWMRMRGGKENLGFVDSEDGGYVKWVNG